uniref:Transcobalamin-like C-terminal domain-containing protein n=1 Tax=Sphaeramia orbicularis TaxID=375764 RepID=A0A673BDL3_9TELE
MSQHVFPSFRFTYREDPNFGPFLVSVNGLAGNDKDQTYWKLLVKSADGETTRLEVGIGCYIPKVNEQVILQFTKW